MPTFWDLSRFLFVGGALVIVIALVVAAYFNWTKVGQKIAEILGIDEESR